MQCEIKIALKFTASRGMINFLLRYIFFPSPRRASGIEVMKVKHIFLKPLFINENINENKSAPSSKPECPYCQEKDLNHFVRVGEDNIKCMSCCNFFE